MKKIATIAIALSLPFTATACGDHPVPKHGKITKRVHNDEYYYWVPGTTTCSGNPPSCVSTPGYMEYVPPEWYLGIQDLNNKDWYGEVHVEPEVFAKCRRDMMWPECWGGTPEQTFPIVDPTWWKSL